MTMTCLYDICFYVIMLFLWVVVSRRRSCNLRMTMLLRHLDVDVLGSLTSCGVLTKRCCIEVFDLLCLHVAIHA